MPGMFRTAAAFLLIFGCMASASAASVRAEEQMEIQAALKAEGTTAQTMTGTAGGANEQVKQETVEETADQADMPKQEETGDAQSESAGREENGGSEAAQEPFGAGSSAEKSASNQAGSSAQKSVPDQAGSSAQRGGSNQSGNEEVKGEETDADDDSKDPEDPDSGRVPIGRRVIGNYGTAYVAGSGGRMMRSAPGSDCTITPGTAHSYGNWATTEFRVVTDRGHYMGYCAQPNKQTPSGIYQVSELDNPRIKMALMFGADGPWAGEASALFGGTAEPYPYVHAMIGIEYTGETDGLTGEQIQAMQNALDEQMNSGKAELSIFKEYRAYVAYNEKQDIVWLEYEGPTEGTLTMRKRSAVPDITDGNSCYSLENAAYGIYADASCTTQSATAIIRKDRKSVV